MRNKVKRVRKFREEFKTFITRGNVIDLAVGMIIGAAFTAIVTALVNNILKPLINSIPMNGLDGLITILIAKDSDGQTLVTYGKIVAEGIIDMSKSIYIDWGAVITAIINFLLTALVLFLIVKAINSMRAAKEKAIEDLKKRKGGEAEVPAPEVVPEEPPKPTVEEEIKGLLTDIRDLLKEKGE